jgi:hypothetical protein
MPAVVSDLRSAVAWLVEREMVPHPQPCNRCGHGRYFHRLDDASNVSPNHPAACFRCIWPMPDGPAVELCDCGHFVEAPDSLSAGEIT